VEAPGNDAAVDCARAEAEIEELLPYDDAVLQFSERCDRRVETTS
jgi:hypothetical protein